MVILQEEKSKLLEKNSKKKEEKNALKAENNEKDSIIEKLSSENQKLSTQFINLEEENRRCLTNISILNDELENNRYEHQQKIDEYSSKIKEFQISIQEQLDEIAKNSTFICNLSNENELLRVQVKSYEEYKNKTQELLNEITKHEASVKSLIMENESLNEKIKEYEEWQIKANEEINELTRKETSIRNENTRALDIISSLTTENESLKEKIKTYGESQSNTQEELNEIKRSFDTVHNLTIEKESLNEKIISHEEYYLNEINKFEEIKAKHDSEIENKSMCIEELNNKLDNLNQEYNKLQESIKSLNDHQLYLEEAIENKKDECNYFKEIKDKYDLEIEEKKLDVEKLKNELDNLNQEAINLQESIKLFNDNKEHLEEIIKDQNNNFEEIKANYDSEIQEKIMYIEKLDNKLNDLNQETLTLQESNKTLADHELSLQEIIKNNTNECNNFEEIKAKYDSEIQEKIIYIEQLNNELDNLNPRILNLKESIKSLIENEESLQENIKIQNNNFEEARVYYNLEIQKQATEVENLNCKIAALNQESKLLRENIKLLIDNETNLLENINDYKDEWMKLQKEVGDLKQRKSQQQKLNKDKLIGNRIRNLALNQHTEPPPSVLSIIESSKTIQAQNKERIPESTIDSGKKPSMPPPPPLSISQNTQTMQPAKTENINKNVPNIEYIRQKPDSNINVSDFSKGIYPGEGTKKIPPPIFNKSIIGQKIDSKLNIALPVNIKKGTIVLPPPLILSNKPKEESKIEKKLSDQHLNLQSSPIPNSFIPKSQTLSAEKSNEARVDFLTKDISEKLTKENHAVITEIKNVKEKPLDKSRNLSLLPPPILLIQQTFSESIENVNKRSNNDIQSPSNLELLEKIKKITEENQTLIIKIKELKDSIPERAILNIENLKLKNTIFNQILSYINRDPSLKKLPCIQKTTAKCVFGIEGISNDIKRHLSINEMVIYHETRDFIIAIIHKSSVMLLNRSNSKITTFELEKNKMNKLFISENGKFIIVGSDTSTWLLEIKNDIITEKLKFDSTVTNAMFLLEYQYFIAENDLINFIWYLPECKYLAYSELQQYRFESVFNIFD